MTRGWSRLHYERYNLYNSPNIFCGHQVKEEMGGACSTHGRVDTMMQKFVSKTSREDIIWEGYTGGGGILK
jgi:hypothetical protein